MYLDYIFRSKKVYSVHCTVYSGQYFQYGSSLEDKAAQVVGDKDKDEEDKEEEDQEDQED